MAFGCDRHILVGKCAYGFLGFFDAAAAHSTKLSRIRRLQIGNWVRGLGSFDHGFAISGCYCVR